MWRDEGLLLDIVESARRILRFTEDVDETQFLVDELVQSAVIRQIEIIGEAAGRVSTAFRVEHPEVPWAMMVAMRNRMIHGYAKVRMEIVWATVRQDIPRLMEQIIPLLPPDASS